MKSTRDSGLTVLLMIVASLFIVLLALSPWWVAFAVLVAVIAWLAASRRGRLTWALLRVGLDSIPRRVGSATVVIVGIAGAVGVLVAVLSIGAGFERALKKTGTEDTVIILGDGARTEAASLFNRETTSLIAQMPEIMKTADGRSIASPELLLIASLPKKSTHLDANVALRGVDPRVWDLRPGAKIVAGRQFGSGLRELIVGKGVESQFLGTQIGSTVQLNGQAWTVVGIFDSGDAHNSEMWADVNVIASTYQRAENVTSLTARLKETTMLDALASAIRADPRLKVTVQTTRDYYSRQSEGFSQMMRIVGASIGAIMALGAIFGALNATYTAIGNRLREIATLRAMGFGAGAVVFSILLETMILAAVGGVIGGALVWLIFDGFTASTAGTSGQVVFSFDVSGALLWNGLKCAIVIGLIGGLMPAIQAARAPIVSGLREL